MKKKIFALVLLICVAATLIACRSTSVKAMAEAAEPAVSEKAPVQEAPSKQVLKTVGVTSPVQAEPEAAPEANAPDRIPANEVSDASICECEAGGYKVEIVSVERSKDYAGTECIKVTYNYTNNTDTQKAFSYAIFAKAYQNGKVLDDSAVIYDYADIMSVEQPISNGQSILVSYLFPVQNYNDDVELEIGIFDGFSAKELAYEKCTVSMPA